jgi:hypothetical protein
MDSLRAGGVKGNGRLSFGFRCDKEMKPNHLGFNLNFDEIFQDQDRERLSAAASCGGPGCQTQRPETLSPG